LAIELTLSTLVIPQMRPHQTLPELAVIRHGEMQQLVDNDIVSEPFIKFEQFDVKMQMPIS
jgi:hypothetical protein